MNILILTVGPRTRASARYRAFMYIPYLSSSGFNVSVLTPATKPSNPIHRLFSRYQEERNILNTARNSDIIFIQKRLFRKKFIQKLKKKCGILIYDFDDIIHKTHDNHWSKSTEKKIRRRFETICKASSLIIAGNSYLSTIASQFNNNIKILPTVVDASKYIQKQHFDSKNINIGWIGQPNNFDALEEISSVFTKIHLSHPEANLLIISKGTPDLLGISIYSSDWSEDTEVDSLQKVDIGIMPMSNNEWSKGKCGLKAIQYMAAGIPVVCSKIGANIDIVRDNIDGYLVSNDDEWYFQLEKLISDIELRKKLGNSGRDRVQSLFCISSSSKLLINWLREVSDKYQKQ